jgi:hypothetical protein
MVLTLAVILQAVTDEVLLIADSALLTSPARSAVVAHLSAMHRGHSHTPVYVC